MVQAVSGARHQLEVFEPVVELVAVPVVDDAPLRDRAMRLFPDQTMLKLPPSLKVNNAIATRHNASFGRDRAIDEKSTVTWTASEAIRSTVSGCPELSAIDASMPDAARCLRALIRATVASRATSLRENHTAINATSGNHRGQYNARQFFKVTT